MIANILIERKKRIHLKILHIIMKIYRLFFDLFITKLLLH